MKVYLAARYSRHPEMRTYAQDLARIGCEVTSRWIEGLLPDDGKMGGPEDKMRKCAEDDLEDLARANCCISFTEKPRDPNVNTRGGRHVEFGFALAMGKTVVVVGHRENVFHCLPRVQFAETWQQAMPIIAALKERYAQLSESALQEAQRLVHGARDQDYGHPIEDYTRTGRIWGALLGLPDIDPRICCLMMAGVKLSREIHKPKRDNRVDLAGYAECAQMVAEKQGK